MPAPGCSGTNGTDAAIPDGTAIVPVESYMAIAGCPGNVSAAATVEVHIKHAGIGNPMVSLVTPSGRAYFLHLRTGGWDHGIDKTYVMNLSAPGAVTGFGGCE